MTSVPLRAQQRLFWRAIRDGCLIKDAAELAGIPVSTGSNWFVKAGGMPSLSLEEPKPRALSILEREAIRSGMDAGETYRQIGARIGRDPSTVWREVKRNLTSQRYSSRTARRRHGPGRPIRREWRYSPHLAQQRADAQVRRPKLAKLAVNGRLRTAVEAGLHEEHSPEQIAATLRLGFPDDPEMWVSHETIYQSLYVQGRGALRRDLTKRLRTGRAVRKPQRKADQRRARVLGMVNISERPAEVADRAVPGHWEGDLIMGSVESNSAIGTLVERASRYLMLLHLPDGHGAEAVQEAMVTAMSQLPDTLRRTLTWDQGIEMANHARIADATDLDLYFCDPHSPWQRGSNENTNGLLRQYFPKSTDLAVYQADYLDHVARKLNTRPRKTLDWKTPAQALDLLLSKPYPPGVAMTG